MSRRADTNSWSPFFIRELQELASFLDDLGMSQEMINMTVAARAGLPIEPVDPKSPIFVWEKGEEGKVPAPEAQPRSLDERREAVLQAIEDMDVVGIVAPSVRAPDGPAAKNAGASEGRNPTRA